VVVTQNDNDRIKIKIQHKIYYMQDRQRNSNEPHDKFIKEFMPVVLKNLFDSQTSVSVKLSEELAIDVLCIAREPKQPITDRYLGLLGRLAQ
jgi:hypothetical protein